MTPCVYCLGTITWHAAWKEWHGRCDSCPSAFFAPDDRCANADCAVMLPPTGTTWTRMEIA